MILIMNALKINGKIETIKSFNSSWGYRKLTLDILNICIYKFTAKTFCFDAIPDGRYGKIYKQ